MSESPQQPGLNSLSKSFEPAALEVFALKKNLRVLQLPVDWKQEPMDVRLVSGGLLLQDADRFPDDIESVAKVAR